MADTANGRAANAANTLSYNINGRQQRLSLLVEQQVIVAEVRTGKMPVKVLRLNIERELIGNERVDGLSHGLCLPQRQVSDCCQRRGGGKRLYPSLHCLFGYHNLAPLFSGTN